MSRKPRSILADRRVAVAFLDPEPTADQPDERMERHRTAEREAMPLLPCDALAHALSQLEEESRLLDAWLSDDEHDRSFAGLRARVYRTRLLGQPITVIPLTPLAARHLPEPVLAFDAGGAQ